MGQCCQSKAASISPDEDEDEDGSGMPPKLDEVTKIKKRGPPKVRPPQTLAGQLVPTKPATPRSGPVLNEFKERLHDYFHSLPSDTTLMRFLRARQLDLGKATEMYTRHRRWRTAFGADTIGDFDFHERNQVIEVYPSGYHQTGRLGHPVYIERVGKLDVDSLLEITTIDRYLKAHVQNYEAMVEHKFPSCALEYKTPVSQIITIMDLEGVSMGFFFNSKNKSILKRVISLDQDNYPECLYKMFVINAPWMFTAAYSVFKTFFDPATLQKIKIMGDDFMEELEKHIDPVNIPTFFGGKCKCKGGCLHKQPGPWDKYKPTDIERRAWVAEGDEFTDSPSPLGGSACLEITEEEEEDQEEEEEEQKDWVPNPPHRVKSLGAVGIRFRRRTTGQGLWKMVPKHEGVFKQSTSWGTIYSVQPRLVGLSSDSKKTAPTRLAPMKTSGSLSPLASPPGSLSPLASSSKLSPELKLPPNTLAPLKTHTFPLPNSTFAS